MLVPYKSLFLEKILIKKFEICSGGVQGIMTFFLTPSNGIRLNGPEFGKGGEQRYFCRQQHRT